MTTVLDTTNATTTHDGKTLVVIDAQDLIHGDRIIVPGTQRTAIVAAINIYEVDRLTVQFKFAESSLTFNADDPIRLIADRPLPKSKGYSEAIDAWVARNTDDEDEATNGSVRCECGCKYWVLGDCFDCGKARPSVDERRTAKIAQIVEQVEFIAADATKAVTKALADLQKGSEYSIRNQWSYLSSYTDAIAAREQWAGIVANAKDVAADGRDYNEAIVDGLRYYLADGTKTLLNNYLRGGSTSATSNACEAAAREATARFIEKATWMIESIDSIA